jgi:glycosyltransferase involved in cell wall biosynthesis
MTVKLGVICSKNWKYFREIYENLQGNFKIRTYDGYSSKLKLISDHEHLRGFIEHRLINKKTIEDLMKWSDVTFFEWASYFLEIGTHLPKRSPVAARLHRFELFKYADKIEWDKIDKLIFVGEGLRRWTLDTIDIDKSKTVVIHNSINTNKFKPIHNPHELTYRLGILGDVIPRKRVYELVHAFKELDDRMPEKNLLLSIAGKLEGEYPMFIKDLVKRLGLTKKVTLEGYVEDNVKWYNNIDIIISHSMHESAHLSLYEGKACGCYPIAYRWDGVEEFLSEDRLYFNNTEFCDRVEKFYNLSDAKREQIQKQGRKEVVNSFGLPKISKQYEELFKSLA